MPVLELTFASGESSLSVRHFSVHEAISGLFTASIVARSANQDLDLSQIVGDAAAFRVTSGVAFAALGGRVWSGIVSSMEQVQAEPTGLSTYHLRIVPTMWLLTQRRNHRIFQHLSIPDIVDRVLDGWSIAPVWQIERGQYPKLEYKAQYGETDYAFVCRLLEEAGIAFTLPDGGGVASQLVFGDALHAAPPRASLPLPWVDNPNQAAEQEFVTKVRLVREVRPGAHAVRDYDFRNPGFALLGEAEKAPPPEAQYEQYHYRPGSFLKEGGQGGDTPTADDKGVARYDQEHGKGLARRALEATRSDQRVVAFATNAYDLHPGAAFFISGHPHGSLPVTAKLLVHDLSFEGAPGEDWTMSGHARFTDVPYRPPARTPKPEVTSVQSAIVVGPAGQEIHTDEFGRVRIQFPWDRDGKSDDGSSCWVRVSQGWAGVGYGMMMIPRVGQEVLVGFLGGDPDHPVVVGRVFNNTQRVPYKLPEHKTRSTWKSDSSPGSDGFNEIMFEDLKGKELVWVQAQKNLRKLVKNDETITIGNNLQKLVKNDETETTGNDRVETTGASRTEITDGKSTTTIGGAEGKIVKGDERERTEGDMMLYVGGDQHVIVNQVKRERVEKDSHLIVQGNLNEQVDKTLSISAGGLQIKVGKNHALGAGEEIHFKAGTALVIEAVSDLTLKGPGGFIRIDAGGVTIKGTLVKINSGGAPGSASDASPASPEDPVEATIDPPDRPAPDDVSKSRIAQ
jgi:type VI secretion system secreted protein VgrG